MTTTPTGQGVTYPILQARIDDGSITCVGAELIGWAADGMSVSIGVEHDAAAAERYLTEHPTPDTW